MTQQDRLFVFIQSLTRTEKSYFTKYARLNATKEKPDYLLLFDYLSEAHRYDEAELKKHFKGEKFISQLARKKTQLKDKIIESLSHCHANHTEEASLRLQMNVLPTLYEKAKENKVLLKEYENQIKAIKKKAKEEDCFSILVDLFVWERRLLGLLDANKGEKAILSLLEIRQQFQNKLNQQLDLEGASLCTELIRLKDPKIVNPNSRRQFQNLVVSVLEKHDSEDLSILAKRYYYYIKCSYLFYEKDWMSAHEIAKNLVNTYSEDDTQDAIISKNYKHHLCNYLTASNFANQLDDYPDTINKLKATASDENIYLFNTIYFKVLNYYLMKRQFKEAISVSEHIYKRWDELCTAVEKRRQLAYCSNFMVVYWFSNKIESAVYWLSKILNFETTQQGQRIINAARIIQLPIYYDYEDDNLENRIDSTRKVLAKKKILSDYRQIILSCFRKLVRCVNQKEKNACISDMQLALLQMKNEHNIKATDLECLLFWSKLKVGEQTLESVNK